MASSRRTTSTNNTSSSSTVQIAFDSDPSFHHCGYCETNGSCSIGACLLHRPSSVLLRKIRSSKCGYCQLASGKISFGVVASMMLIDDYQALMDRGWRKCGTYYYKALMDLTCCPLYTIRCDANNFQSSRSQRRVIQTLNAFINKDIKPAANVTQSSTTNEKKSQRTATNKTNESDKSVRTIGEWLTDAPTTNANRLVRHMMTNETPPTDDLLKQLRARQKRWYRKLQKLKGQNKLTPDTDIQLLIKRFQRMKMNRLPPLEEMLKLTEQPKNKLEFRLVRSYPPSDDFKRSLTVSHSIYQRYQMAIHGDSKSKCSMSQFQGFLCESSLQKDCPRLGHSPTPACGYGCFHLQYYLNEKMIACSVIDILPGGVSSVYFYYEPDLGFLKLGVYSALKEIELTQKLSREVPDLKYYYLGFYVHTCTKMRYKGQYKPSFLLCPETYTWHPIEKCVPLLDQKKYVRFESDPNKTDENEGSDIEHLQLRISRQQVINPAQLQAYNENFFFNILDRFLLFAKFVGRVCVNRIVIDVN